jgi:hypothetical protein
MQEAYTRGGSKQAMYTGELLAVTILVALVLLSWRLGRYFCEERTAAACDCRKAEPSAAGTRASGVVHCLHCQRALRIGLPPRSNLVRCPQCGHRFAIVLWDSGNNLYISPADEDLEEPAAQGGPRGSEQISLYLETLGLDPRTSEKDVNLREVRKAYYKAIQQYHPDKYTRLPTEFRRIAERKTRELHAAYQGLVQVAHSQKL